MCSPFSYKHIPVEPNSTEISQCKLCMCEWVHTHGDTKDCVAPNGTISRLYEDVAFLWLQNESFQWFFCVSSRENNSLFRI